MSLMTIDRYQLTPKEREKLAADGLIREPVHKPLVPPPNPSKESLRRRLLHRVQDEIRWLAVARQKLPDCADKAKLDGAMFAYRKVQAWLREGGI